MLTMRIKHRFLSIGLHVKHQLSTFAPKGAESKPLRFAIVRPRSNHSTHRCFGFKSFVLILSSSVSFPTLFVQSMGAGIWPTSVSWLRFIQTTDFQHMCPKSGSGGKLLDLGSGHGLCGISCGALGHWDSVVVTDKVMGANLKRSPMGHKERILYVAERIRGKVNAARSMKGTARARASPLQPRSIRRPRLPASAPPAPPALLAISRLC
jgi:hypothetical protein